MIQRTNARSALALISLCAFAPVLIGCTDLPTGPADGSRVAVKGITLADWTASGYRSADAAVTDIAATGANTLAIVITAYQTDTAASAVRSDNERTPSAVAVASVTSFAKSLPIPLRVVLKFHVDVDTGEWRGHISPADPGAWFNSYRRFLAPYLVLTDFVDQIVVGTELAGTLGEENRWRALIEDVRAATDGVEMVYAASWDEAPKVPFWDALDRVGVNFYAPVARRKESGRLDLLLGWQPWIDRMRLLHKQANRPVVLTEIGYRSVDGAGLHPYDFRADAALDLEEQADLYWAALEAIGDKPWIEGIYWWNWLVDASPTQELKDFTPRGKPAEAELVGAWQ